MLISLHRADQVSLGLPKRSEMRAWWEDDENCVPCRCGPSRVLVVW